MLTANRFFDYFIVYKVRVKSEALYETLHELKEARAALEVHYTWHEQHGMHYTSAWHAGDGAHIARSARPERGINEHGMTQEPTERMIQIQELINY